MHLGQQKGSIPAIVSRCGIFLLETLVMFLVDNHQPQVFHRQEYGTAGAQNHNRLPRALPVPFEDEDIADELLAGLGYSGMEYQKSFPVMLLESGCR